MDGPIMQSAHGMGEFLRVSWTQPDLGNISVEAIEPIEQSYFTVMKARVQFGQLD